jgi:hypothetical protein
MSTYAIADVIDVTALRAPFALVPTCARLRAAAATAATAARWAAPAMRDAKHVNALGSPPRGAPV